MADKRVSDMEAKAFTVAHQALAEPLKAVVDVLNLATKVHANDTPSGETLQSRQCQIIASSTLCWCSCSTKHLGFVRTNPKCNA